jgi:CPA2 family monovalent cation:H+ antiporter-2/glutathione-regulated potassium-efflux system protein KefB
MLVTLVALLAAATVAVPLTRRAGLGSVLGYLIAGLVIGPSGLRLVTDVEQIATVASLGVIMLMFLIGLELRPRRLWIMRRSVFGLGSAQVLITALCLAGLAVFAGVPPPGAAVVGLGLALSSTAIVLPMLGERDLLTTPAGRDAFAVLLFQDLAFIPLVALVPLLASGHAVTNGLPWLEVGEGVAAIVIILAGGRFLMGPLFKAIGGASSPELFTTVALLIVAGTALLAQTAGLSPSLGAFLAGVMLSASEYRHELQADIAPFENTLLGFFFISVGMSADLHAALARPVDLAVTTSALLVVKILVAFVLARLVRRDKPNAIRFSLAIPQASEFSFVLLGAAVAVNALSANLAALSTLISAASMLITPILFAVSERFLIPRLRSAPAPEFDTIEASDEPVIIAGFGRMGQIVGRVLRMHNIAFTALEQDAGQVDVVRRFGSKVYYGDAARPDVLRAAGADRAKLLVVALDDTDRTLRTVETAKRNHPNLTVLARARNRHHAHLLMDRDVDGLIRDTFFSSLRLAELSLIALGIPADDAARGVALFQQHDEANLVATHSYYRDEAQLIQSAQQATDELASLFQADHEST